MKVSVAGVGYVGLVSAACLAEGGNHVTCVDSNRRKIRDLQEGIIPIYERGLSELVHQNVAAGRLRFTTRMQEAVEDSLVIVIAVGTPSQADGSADISAVLSVAAEVAELMDDYRIIVTKSTVPVGTHQQVCEVMRARTEKPFDYVSNPEFLKEGAAVEDFTKPDRVIIGTENPAVMEIMKQLYAPYMRKSSRMIFMDPASAELSKYAANVMLATRISFMNEISQLCETYGADVELIRAGVGSDGRIGNAFLFAGLGFGGSCFPKDVRALIHMGQLQGMPMRIAEAAQEANLAQQKRFAERVVSYYGDGADKVTLGVWGLAFKARTDDVRESPALTCVERFLEAGMRVQAYDPEATPAASALAGRMKTVGRSEEALVGADGLVICTDWQEFRTPDFEMIKATLKRPVVFDGRNLYDGAFVSKYGLEYHSVGRPTRKPAGA